MRYEESEIYCHGCRRRILKPSDCDMELFRLGLYIHTECLEIYNRISERVERLHGVVPARG